MPERKTKSQKHKVAFFGELTLANTLDWCVTLCICGLIALTLHQLGGARPATMILSSWLLGLALFFHVLSLIAEKPREPFSFNSIGLVFLPYLGYLFVHWLWLSPYGWKGIEELMTTTQAIVIFWLVVQNFRTRNHVWLFLLMLIGMSSVGILMGIMQYFHSPEWLPKLVDPISGESITVKLPEQYHGRASGFFGAPGSFAAFLLLTGLPLIAAAFCKRFTVMARMFLLYAGLMSVGGVLMSVTRGALLVLVPCLYLVPFVARAKRRSILLSWAIISALLAGVGLAMMQFNEGFRDRIETAIDERGERSRPIMWEAAWTQFTDAPVLGNGIGAYEYLFENSRPEGFNRQPAHAHNDFLETLADQGVIGFVLFWGAVGYLAFRAFREWLSQPDAVKISGLATKRKGNFRMPTPKFLIGTLGLGLLAFCAHLALEFHLRVPGLAFTFFAILGVVTKCAPGRRFAVQRNLASYAACIIGGFGLMILLPAWMVPEYTALEHAQEGRRQLTRFREKHDALKRDPAYYEEMMAALREALAASPDHADAWADLSGAVAAQHYLNPSKSRDYGREAEQCARNALRLNPESPTAWIHLGIALSLQGRMDEAGEAFAHAVAIAPNRADTWHYQAAYLNQLKSTRPQALEAVDRALELEPGREDSLDLRRKILVP